MCSMLDSTFSLWNSGHFDAFATALRQRVTVRLKCCMRWEGKPTDLIFYGRFRSVEGRDAQFLIRDMKVLPDKPKGYEGNGEFFFCLEHESSPEMVERVGFQGTAIILGTKSGTKEALRFISLRLPRTFVTRKMRRDKRVPWGRERSRLAGATIVTTPPETKADLRDMIAACYEKNPKALHLIDLSAGGACACLPGGIASTPLSAKPVYLFFLAPSAAPPSSLPHVFLAKKLGFCQESCEKGYAVRLFFQKELNWEESQTQLEWTDIEAVGSRALRTLLDQYDDGEDDEWLRS